MAHSRIFLCVVAVAAGLGAGGYFVASRPQAKTSIAKKESDVASPSTGAPAIAAISSTGPDPAALAVQVLALPPGLQQARAIREVARDFVRRYPAHALEWALKLEDAAPRGAALDEITRELVALDPRRTLSALAKLPAGLATEEALSSAAAHWARHDAAGAFGWLREVPDASVRARLLGGMGFELAEVDPRAGLRLATDLFTGEERELLTMGVVAAWSARDPQGALAWAQEDGDPAVTERRVREVIAGLAQTVPAEAATLLERMAPGAQQAEAALAVAESWAARDAARAAAWVASLPDLSLRTRVAPVVVTEWSGHAPTAAGAWVRALPPGPMREAAVEAHVRILKVEHIAVAARWLGSLPGGERPAPLFAQVAREWLAVEPEVARRWLAEQGVAH